LLARDFSEPRLNFFKKFLMFKSSIWMILRDPEKLMRDSC
jgi:hypothetical protein